MPESTSSSVDTSPKEALPPPDETAFGQYQLIEKIAQGGMAEIFKGKALDVTGVERPVVIKRILPHIAASPEFVDMLVDEAKIAVMLSHGNIAQVYDLGKVADDYFIVMEYVDGKTISQIMKRLRTLGKLMPIPFILHLCSEVANGLDYMHRKVDESGNNLNIVHRDISPQNVMVSSGGTVKIIDFGIAKAKTKISTTDSGILKGKFSYMSPEHAEGLKLDHRTDIFSLGVILFEMLTGQRLFKSKTNLETIRKVKKTKIPLPSGIRASIPKELDKAVLKVLQRDRDKRYESAHDLAQDLNKVLFTKYPDFSPRNLVRFLQELFPEAYPGEKIVRQEETDIAPLEIKREENERENTVVADSEILRLKLKESEVFDVPARLTPPMSEEEPSVSNSISEKEAVSWDEHTSRIKFIPLLKKILLGGVALGIVFALGGGVFYLYKKQALDQQRKESLARIEELRKQRVARLMRPAPELPVQAPLLPMATAGQLIINSTPVGASISINNQDTNKKTPATFDNLPSGPTKISLYLERYRFWEGSAVVRIGASETLSVPLEINSGGLEINSLPVGAQVLLNGQIVGNTPYQLKDLNPDTVYEVVLQQPGYESWKSQVKIFGGKTEVVSASLKKLSFP